MEEPAFRHHKYWRLYRTASGNRIIYEEIKALDARAYANVYAAMREVEELGVVAASKPVQGEIREIDADGEDHTGYRLLFAVDGYQRQMLLGLVLFNKKTQKTPKRYIDLAEERLKRWRAERAAMRRESR